MVETIIAVGFQRRERSLWSAVVISSFLEEIEFEEDLEEWIEFYWIERERIGVSGLQVLNKSLKAGECVI